MRDEDFDKITSDIMKQHAKLFESLAEKDNLEYDIVQWIVQNKEGLRDKLKTLDKPYSSFFPPSLYDVYLSEYEEAALKLIREEVASSLQLNPEMSLRVDKECVKLGAQDLLYPPKKD